MLQKLEHYQIKDSSVIYGGGRKEQIAEGGGGTVE